MRRSLNASWAFDTNVLVYLLDRRSTHFKSAQNAFETAEKQEKDIVITHQNLVELIQVLTTWYKLALKTAVSKVEKITNLNITLVNPLPHTLSTYLDLCKKDSKPKNHFDLYLAATLLDNDVTTLITNDPSGFKTVKGITTLPLSKFK